MLLDFKISENVLFITVYTGLLQYNGILNIQIYYHIIFHIYLYFLEVLFTIIIIMFSKKKKEKKRRKKSLKCVNGDFIKKNFTNKF